MQSIKDILAKHIVSSAGENPGSSEQFVQQESNFSCPTCQDKGIVLVGEVATPCSCMKQRELFSRFKHARMSEPMRRQTFSNFKLDYYSRLLVDPDKEISYYEAAGRAFNGAQKFVADYLENENIPGLMFLGPVGSGKTFLACAIANALVERNKQVLFLVVPDLLDELRASFGKKNGDTEQDLLDTARTVHVLILDDLGAHNYTEWTINRIYSIINYRLNHNLPTVITTNLDVRELDEHLGERTCSRLLQMCRGYKIMVDKDIRMLKYMEREKRG